MGVFVVVAVYVHSAVSVAVWVRLGTLLAATQVTSHLQAIRSSYLPFFNEPHPAQMAIDTTEW